MALDTLLVLEIEAQKEHVKQRYPDLEQMNEEEAN